MGTIWLPGGGGGGEGSDECTLTLQDVPRGLKAITKDSDDEAREGTLNTETSVTDTIVLSGETYMKFNQETKHWEKHTGSLVNRGAWTARIGINGKALIPAGFHNGAGYVDQAVTNRGAWTSNVEMNGEVTVPEGYHNGTGKVSGPSITQCGAVTATLNCGGSYAIPEGYHHGGGKVTANSLASQTSGNAGAADIISGRSSWVNGSKVVGSMADYRSTPTEIDAIRLNNSRFEVAVKAGCHGYNWAGNGYEYMSYAQVASAIGLSAGVIKKGVRIMNLTGTFEGYVPTATDLYNNGNNVASFTNVPGVAEYKQVKFESAMFTVPYNDTFTTHMYTANKRSLTGFNYLNIDINITKRYETTPSLVRVVLRTMDSTPINMNDVNAQTIVAYVHSLGLGRQSVSIPISGLSYIKHMLIGFMNIAGNGYRVWLS